MREAYTRALAILPPSEVSDIIMRGGFDLPMHFFQAGLIHAWYAGRSFNNIFEVIAVDANGNESEPGRLEAMLCQ